MVGQPIQRNYYWLFISRYDIKDSQFLDFSYERVLPQNYQIGLKYAFCKYLYNSIYRPYKKFKDGDYTLRDFDKWEISFGKCIRKKKNIFALSLVVSKINGSSGIYTPLVGALEKYTERIEYIKGNGFGISNTNKFGFWKHFFLSTDISYNYYLSQKWGIVDAYFGLGVAF